MATISVYRFEDDGEMYIDWTTQDYKEACEYAKERKLRVIEDVFEWADSEVLEDYTEDDEDDEDYYDEDEDEDEEG